MTITTLGRRAAVATHTEASARPNASDWTKAALFAETLSGATTLLVLTAQLHKMPLPFIHNSHDDGPSLAWVTTAGHVTIYQVIIEGNYGFEVETISAGTQASQYFATSTQAINAATQAL